MKVRLDSDICVHTPIKRSSSCLFKTPVAYRKPSIEYHAVDLMKNGHISTWNKCLLDVVDKVSLVMDKHPKIGKCIIGFAEKMLTKNV